MSTAQLLILCFFALIAIAVLAGAAVFVTREQHASDPRAGDHAAEIRDAIQDLGRLVVAARASDASLRAPLRVGRRVTVHTKPPADQTIFGVVTGDYEDRLVLEDAEYVTTSGRHPLPGRQDIPATDIAWLDVHQLVVRDDPRVEAVS